MVGAAVVHAPARTDRTRRTAGRLPAASTVLVWLGVLLGIALRLRQYAFDRSLWLDEISLAEDIRRLGFRQLSHPLASGQAAPVGFLWSEHLSTRLFGDSELSLRLVPVLGSLLAMVVIALLARRALPGPAAAVAVFLFATSPQLLFYSSEVKQYSTDVAATLVLVYATVLLRPRPGVGGALAWAVVAAAVTWFSQPAIPVAACCVLVIAVRAVRSLPDLLRLLPGGALLAASVLAEYVVTLRAQSQSQQLRAYWEAYGGYPPEHGSVARWYGTAVTRVLHDPMALRHTDLVVVLLAVGAAGLLLRRERTVLALLVLPIVAGTVLALVRAYPLAQRLALYLLPVVVLLLAAGLSGLPGLRRAPEPSRTAVDRRRRTARVVAAGCSLLVAAGLVVVSYSSVARGATVLGRPIDLTAGREAVAYVAAHQRPGDVVVYEQGWAEPTIAWYGPIFHVTPTASFGFQGAPGAACDPRTQLAPPGGATRVWVVFAHHGSNEPGDRTAVYLSRFAQLGTVEQSYTGAGQAGAYLVDYAAPPVDPPPLVAASWARGCLALSPATG